MNDERRDRLGEGDEVRERGGSLRHEERDVGPDSERSLPGALFPRPPHEDECPFTD